jgi:putative colanic acid biosynthesis glycosyltransferase
MDRSAPPPDSEFVTIATEAIQRVYSFHFVIEIEEIVILLSDSGNVLSIVTISKNDLSGFRSTVESLIAQGFQAWDCLVVLPSKDDDSYNEVKRIIELDSRFTLLLQQEPGIYEAMNLALDHVVTKYVWFMNGGDKFASDDTLSESIEILTENKYNLLIGGYTYSEGIKKRIFIKRTRNLSAPRFSLNIRGGCHQSMLFDFSSNSDLRFNTEFRMCADFDYVLNFLGNGRALRINRVLAEIDPNGVSSLQISEVLREKQRIRRQHFGYVSAVAIFGKIQNLLILSKVKLRKILKSEIAQSI